ncbi:MAG: Dabb family protein [Bacillota bacterium]
MIRHVVLFKIADPEAVQKAKEMLLELPSKIDFIRSWEVGCAYGTGERIHELALISTFDSKEDLQRYDEHPAHAVVRDYIRAVRQGSAACDYEF